MTLAHGTDRLDSARLVLRRITMDDLPFYTRLHGLPNSRAVSLSRRVGRAQPNSRKDFCGPFSKAMNGWRSVISRSYVRKMER
jgi:hypothetical protein